MWASEDRHRVRVMKPCGTDSRSYLAVQVAMRGDRVSTDIGPFLSLSQLWLCWTITRARIETLASHPH